jgi:nucleoside-diphosphate-sugar epimerase
MRSDYAGPLNMGTDHMVSIDELARLVLQLAGRRDVKIRHVEGPQGVRGRNSDNSKLLATLGWEPQIGLEEGLAVTYDWIKARVRGR